MFIYGAPKSINDEVLNQLCEFVSMTTWDISSFLIDRILIVSFFVLSPIFDPRQHTVAGSHGS